MQVPTASVAGLQAATNKASESDSLRGLQLDDFLKLMIAELRNQDPLDPLENKDILQQISQIREIGATAKLTDTLDAVLLGQNINSAAGLIGKQVRALTNFGDFVTGEVDRVTIAGGDVQVHVGDQQVTLKNVSEIF